MQIAFLSRPAGRIAFAVVVAAFVFVTGSQFFREPMPMCLRATMPGTVVTVRGIAHTTTYVPEAFSLPLGASSVVVDTPDGRHATGTVTVYDGKSAVLSFASTDTRLVPGEVEVDMCAFLADSTTYATENDGVITVEYSGTHGVERPGFTLTRSMRDGERAPANVEVSPDGRYVAYITWNATTETMDLGVAEVSGKNNVVLASLTPEQGEMPLEDLAWSGSRSVVYAETVPLPDGPDAAGNTRQKTLYKFDVFTHARSGIHIDLLP